MPLAFRVSLRITWVVGSVCERERFRQPFAGDPFSAEKNVAEKEMGK